MKGFRALAGAAPLALGLWLESGSAHAAWAAEHWLAAGFGAEALVGAAATALLVTTTRQAACDRADFKAEVERLGRDSATFRDALARAPALLLFWRRGQPEAQRITAPGPAVAPFKDIAVRRLDNLASHLDGRDFEELRAALAGLEAGGRLRRVCRSADGRRSYEAVAVADGESVVLTLSDRTEQAALVHRLEAEVREHRKEAEHLRGLADALGLPVWRRDERLDLVWCNAAYAGAVEMAREAVLKHPGVELIAPLPGVDARAIARRAKTEGHAASLRYHVVVKGERRLLEITEAPAADGGTIGWARDVTELEEAESALKRHISGHAEVLESLSTAIAIYGANARLSFFNAEFAKLYQLDEAFLRGEPTISEVIDALRERRRLPEQADWRAYKLRINRLFTSVTEPVEELLHLPDGAAFRQIITPHPFGGLLFITQDVTDRFALERSHSTLAAVQRATLDNLYEAVAVFGADGRLKLSNPGYAVAWGLNAERLATQPHLNDILDMVESHFTAADFERYRREFIARVSERQRSNQRLVRRDGKVFDCAYVPLPDGATLISYLDISDSVQVERALRERTEALETADRLKSEFVANVSYELRTPLNTVIGFTEILVNQYFGPLNERQLEYARGVLESSQQLLSLINDILDLATIEAGLIVLEIESVDLHGVLVSMLDLVQEAARKKRLELVLDCSRTIGRLEADERRLKQVLFNLLSNALKFTPAGGKVTLGARRNENSMTVWVADTGIGIEREEQKTVFEKFRRGASPLARQSGAGLGLSLVRYFVELHGGELKLDPQPDIGTTVTCTFPLSPPVDARATLPFSS
jgi:signal transduction histidine kinase